MSSTEYRDLAYRLEKLEESGDNDISVYKVHTLFMPDSVTSGTGGASIELSEEEGYAKFTISLGPVNAGKLIDFLRSLPEEPGHELECEP